MFVVHIHIFVEGSKLQVASSKTSCHIIPEILHCLFTIYTESRDKKPAQLRASSMDTIPIRPEVASPSVSTSKQIKLMVQKSV